MDLYISLQNTLKLTNCYLPVQFSSVTQSCPTLCYPMNHSTPTFLSITNSRSLPKLMCLKSMMPSSHLILWLSLLLLPLTSDVGLNCGVGEDSWESFGLQGDPTSPSKRKSILNIHFKDWCWNSNTWPLDVKTRHIGKDPDAGKDRRQKEKGAAEDEMVR